VAGWLDKWEELPEPGRLARLADFIREYCQGAPPEAIEEFRAQVQALDSMEARMALAGGLAHSTADSATGETTDPKGFRLDLYPGSEPVPGYRLQARLGKGGFGEVWRATAPGGLPVALKFVPLDPQIARPELRALEILKHVRHPHLLATVGAWQHSGHIILAMELADGTLYQHLLEAQGRGLPGIPREELLRYMEEVAMALDFLHDPHPPFPGKRGIQHRDIKPHNLFLQGGSIKVGDLGLARALAQSLTANTGNLTPAYAAPEFFRGQTSAHSDQYSLAITYCQLRGGRLPFAGSPEELVTQHLNEPPDLSMLPDGERPVVARALRKEPCERWPSCQVFVERLGGTPAVDSPYQSVVHPSGVSQVWCLPTGVGPVRCLAFSADGVQALLGTAGNPPLLGLWDLRDGREARRYEGHALPVRSVAFSPRGTEVFSSSEDGTLRSWDLGSGREWRRFEGFRGVVNCLALSSGGSRLVSGGTDLRLRLWDVVKGQEEFRFGGWFSRGHTNSVIAVCFSPDGRAVLSGGADQTVRLWDAKRGRELVCLRGHAGWVRAVAFAADARHALSGSDDQSVRLWDLKSRKEVRCFAGQHGPVTCVACAPSRKLALAGCRDGVIRAWDLTSGQERFCVEAHAGKVLCVICPPNGDTIVSGDSEGSLKAWRLPP
jgi:WD40 repeat protein